MESLIWRVKTEKIGFLQAFSSEREMEAFLMSNPAILGFWDPGLNTHRPHLLKQQINLKMEGKAGRIDLLAFGNIEDNYEIRIFELKAEDITEKSVEQLDWYLKAWKQDNTSRSYIKEELLDLKLKGMGEKSIDNILDNPVGVLVGPKFLPESILKARDIGIGGIRLARFKASTSSEYYVIVENQIGDGMPRSYWRWTDLIDNKLITISDDFSISHKGIKLFAKADPKRIEYYWKYLVFGEKSGKKLLDNENNIRKNYPEDNKKWLDKMINKIKKRERLTITQASALFFYAFGGPYPSCYWTPNGWWIHEKTGKPLGELISKIEM